jgi:predicted dehydrogenase
MGRQKGGSPVAEKTPTPVKVGVLGCGYWGSKHARVLAGIPEVDEVVLIDANPRICNRISRAFSAARTFSSLELALPHVDAVVVATPPNTHAGLAIAAMREGKHVLVEKPLATSVAEASMMLAQARDAEVVLMVGHTFLYNPAVRELRRRLKAGDLGDILYIHSSRLNLGLYQADVDVVWDLAPHDISVLNFLLDAVPGSVSAWGESLAFGGVNDLAQFRLEYNNPHVVGFAHLSWLDPRKTRRVTVVGSEKMAVYDDLAEERLRIYDRGLGAVDEPPSPDRPLTYRYGDMIAPHIGGDEPLAVQDEHFVHRILDGAPPETDGAAGLAVVAILESIEESIRQNRRTPVAYPRAPEWVRSLADAPS